MATRYILNINNNDELHTVIKKCNTNFKAIMSQVEKTSKNGSRQREEITENIGDAINDVVRQLGAEAELRRTGDEDLSNAIETVDGKFTDYTKTTDLLRVVLPYSHDDILWVIENNTVGEVMKKTNVSGYTDLVVRCVGEDGNPCYTPLVLIPEDSYQNYTANGKTFKMQINTSDNGRLWWVVPAGKWELWMR